VSEAKVEDLDTPIARDHHVAGLQIAVRDAVRVGVRHGLDKRRRQLQQRGGCQPALGDQLIQGAPVHELHGEEAHAVSFFDGVQRDDVRVVEGRDGARLALEACERLGVRGDALPQQLERHLAPEADVDRAPHHSSATFAERLQQALVEQRVSGLVAHARRASLR
jgi:hypothetical protein